MTEKKQRQQKNYRLLTWVEINKTHECECFYKSIVNAFINQIKHDALNKT